MKKFMLYMVVLAALMTFAAACGNTGNSGEANGLNHSPDSSGNQSSDNQGSEEQLSGKLTIGGSTALQPLAAAAAQQFMEKHPGVQIQVQGGGSGTGLSQVAKGTFDIGMSDYFAESKDGIDAGELVDHKVAVVGITGAVNSEAGVKNLSQQDLIKVFTGKVKNWSELGGKDQKITLVNRPDDSGTRATFVQFALKDKTPAEGVTEDASNTVKKIIADQPGAIGYLALSYFDKNPTDVVKLSVDGVEATPENIQSGKFPIWAYEHMYTKGKPNKAEKVFLDYMMSDEIQNDLVGAQGYIAASKMQVKRNADGEISKR